MAFTKLLRSRSLPNIGQSGGMLSPVAGDHIKVVIRVRPIDDCQIGNHKIVKVLDSRLLIFDPKEEDETFYFRGRRQSGRDFTKRTNKDITFMFDSVFDESSTNEDVFECTTKEMINGLLNGVNCSVFAYGATGAGKTFTMLGSPSNPGIVFLTVMELYRRIEEIKDEKICSINVSYFEVYNETIRDLLKPSKSLQVHEDPQRGVFISELSFHQPNGATHLLEMLQQGNGNRTQHPTDCNAESSRSHAVFQVHVQQKDRTANLSSVVRVAKMSLIDLAGSEKAKATSGQIARFREGANINKSLLALGSCINALAAKRTKSNHIPYRNSKLTRILKDSLGGNCRTVMIAAVSSASSSYDDTYNTLRYADRAKNIQLTLKPNTMNVDVHVSKYAKIVEDLRTEVTQLKEKLNVYECNQNSAKNDLKTEETDDAPVHNVSSDNIEKYCDKVRQIFEERNELRKSLLEFDSSLHQLQVKMHWRKIGTERISLLSSDQNQINKSVSKTDAALRSMLSREQHIRSKKEETLSEVEKNNKILEEYKKELCNIFNKGTIPKIIEDCIQQCQLQLEKEELSLQLKHSREVAFLQERESMKHERTFRRLLCLIREEHSLLAYLNHLTPELQGEYDAVLREVTGLKEVAWADQDRKTNRYKPVSLSENICKSSELIDKTHLAEDDENVCDENEPPDLPSADTNNCSPHVILKRCRDDDDCEIRRTKFRARRSLSETFCAYVPQPVDEEVMGSVPSTPVLLVPHPSCSETFIATSPFHCIQNQTFTASPAMHLNCTFTPPAIRSYNISPFKKYLSSFPRPPLNEVQNTPTSTQKQWIKSPKNHRQNTPNLTKKFARDSITTSKGIIRRNNSLNHIKIEPGKEISTGYRILDRIYQKNHKADLDSLRVPNSNKRLSNVSSSKKCQRPRHRKSFSENRIHIHPNLGENKNEKLLHGAISRKQQMQRIPTVPKFHPKKSSLIK